MRNKYQRFFRINANLKELIMHALNAKDKFLQNES
jgi:hypothetical protein